MPLAMTAVAISQKAVTSIKWRQLLHCFSTIAGELLARPLRCFSLSSQKQKGSDAFLASHLVLADPITHKGNWFVSWMPDFAMMAIRKCVSFLSHSGKQNEIQKHKNKRKLCVLAESGSEQAISAVKCPRVPNTNSLRVINSFRGS